MRTDSARDFCKEGAQLSDAHLKLIVGSAIAPEIARERAYRTINTKAELERYGFGKSQRITPTLLIPLYSATGKHAGYQHRPDLPRGTSDGKLIKYEAPAKSRTVIDVHPALSRKRVKQNDAPYFDQTELPPLIVDPTVPLFITEGVRKADAAVSIQLCCVALLGVWNWRGTNEAGGKVALADWESIALDSRLTYIVFDSDAMVKAEVAAALSRLKLFLEGRGATVKLIYLPFGTHGEKVGLDDFIAQPKTAGRSDAEIHTALLARATDELRKPENANKSANSTRCEIILQPGRSPQTVDEAEQILVKNAEPLKVFQRSGEVVRIISLTRQDVERAEKRDRVNRPEGAVVLHPVRAVALVEIFDRLIAWQRYNRLGELVPADCPIKIANTYLSRVGLWRLPYLAGVVEAPILRPDGSVLNKPGYDSATALFLTSDEEWAPIPESPSLEEAKIAAERLLAPFDQFPFAACEDKSVLLAGILTAMQRRLLESAPLFAFTAPAQRSGKSKLAESIGLIATGRKPAAMSVARDDAEFRKAITSVLREGHLSTNLDNITHPLDSPDLAKAITQSEYRDRLLGVNETVTLLTNVFWTATGNNLTFKGDLPSRVLLCTIDAEMERPEEREFKIPDLQGYLLEHRKELVIAALTILRAYHEAGRPKQNVKPWGGFDQWSRDIREPILWLGLADPCRTPERVIVNDPERELNADVLRQWFDAFGDSVKLTRDVIDEAQKEDRHPLKAALLAVAAERENAKEIDPRRFGRWCASIEGRIVRRIAAQPPP